MHASARGDLRLGQVEAGHAEHPVGVDEFVQLAGEASGKAVR